MQVRFLNEIQKEKFEYDPPLVNLQAPEATLPKFLSLLQIPRQGAVYVSFIQICQRAPEIAKELQFC